MKYEVVHKKSFEKLIEEVNKLMDSGWEPAGGICYTPASFAGEYAQAMILKNSNS